MLTAESLSELGSQVFAALGDLADALDLPRDELSRSEHLEECHLLSFCSGNEFTERFRLERVLAWFTALGSDLTVRVTAPEGQLVASQANYQEVMGILHKMVEEIEVDSLSIAITLRKDALKSRLAACVRAPIDGLFFFEEALHDRLTLDGIQLLLDQKVLSPERHGVIAVMSSTGLLTSAYLTIAGLQGLVAADVARHPSPAYAQRKWQHVQALRDSIALWATPLQAVAPEMFLVEQRRPGLESIYQALSGICDVLSLLQFYVSVSRHDKSAWRATSTYPSGRVIDVACNTPFSHPRDPSTTGLAPAPYRLYRWAFSADNYDKIDVVRDLLQREGVTNEAATLAHVIEATPQLLESARANYKILRHKAFEAYLRSRQEAKSAIAAFTLSARKNLQTIRNDMLQRVLQFFAGLVAYLAASVLQPTLPQWVKVTGVIGGLVYIGLIIGFQMVPIWNQYWQERDEAQTAVQSLTELTQVERTHILTGLPSARRNTVSEFTVWWWLCCGVYGLGALALFYAFWLLTR